MEFGAGKSVKFDGMLLKHLGPYPELFTTDDTDITDVQCWKLLMIDPMLFHGAQTARIAVSELS